MNPARILRFNPCADGVEALRALPDDPVLACAQADLDDLRWLARRIDQGHSENENLIYDEYHTTTRECWGTFLKCADANARYREYELAVAPVREIRDRALRAMATAVVLRWWNAGEP